MNEPVFRNSLLEAVFRQAVIDNFKRELKETEAEPDIVMTEHHKQQMKMLFAKERKHERNRVVIIWTKRLVIGTVTLFIILSCALLTVPEVRASVKGTIITWYNEFTKFVSDDANDENAEWYPTYIPDGFTEVYNKKLTSTSTIRYSDSDDNFIEFQYLPADGSISINNEGLEYSRIEHNGTNYHLFEDRSVKIGSSVVWDMNGYRFTINGYIPSDELLEIAWSVIKK